MIDELDVIKYWKKRALKAEKKFKKLLKETCNGDCEECNYTEDCDDRGNLI